MTFLDLFRRRRTSAQTAGQRLHLILARERPATRGGAGRPDYLERLKQDLLAVLAKYETIDLEKVSVDLDRNGDCDVLELNVVLPEEDEGGKRMTA